MAVLKGMTPFLTTSGHKVYARTDKSRENPVALLHDHHLSIAPAAVGGAFDFFQRLDISLHELDNTALIHSYCSIFDNLEFCLRLAVNKRSKKDFGLLSHPLESKTG